MIFLNCLTEHLHGVAFPCCMVTITMYIKNKLAINVGYIYVRPNNIVNNIEIISLACYLLEVILPYCLMSITTYQNILCSEIKLTINVGYI